jgi:hypothetical protein
MANHLAPTGKRKGSFSSSFEGFPLATAGSLSFSFFLPPVSDGSCGFNLFRTRAA